MRYAVFLAVAPVILTAVVPPLAGNIEAFAILQLPITFYCMPAALLFGHNGGGHFFMHVEVRPADFIGWGSLSIFWLAVSAVVATAHTLSRDGKKPA
jgi:hypothetical protein